MKRSGAAMWWIYMWLRKAIIVPTNILAQEIAELTARSSDEEQSKGARKRVGGWIKSHLW